MKLALSEPHRRAGGRELVRNHEKLACERIALRKPRDRPVVAVALLLNIPIRTEDQDFFGSGVPPWTTDRVEVYLRRPDTVAQVC